MPIPLSSTHRSRAIRSSASGSAVTWMPTKPLSVNLMALLSRLERICLKRSGSISTSQAAASTSISSLSCRPFCLASPSKILATDSTSSRSLARSGISVRRPDSILATSRMSPISSSSDRADSWATSSGPLWLQLPQPLPSSASSSMPITALSGVRISWLMVARKVLLMRLASSACSLAICNC
ncbi:hypothetical protein D3C76_886330 [compost metagenome]